MAINPAHYYTGDVAAVLPADPTFSGTGTFGKIAVGGGALGAGDIAAFGGPVSFPFAGVYTGTPNIQFGASGEGRLYGLGTQVRMFANNATLMLLTSSDSATALELWPTNASGQVVINSTTGYHFRSSQHGVTLGTAVPTPTAGRAFQVSTTAFASSLYVEDSTGHVRMANSNQRILLGPGADLQLYADTSGSPYGTVSALTGTLLLRGQATQGVVVRADNAAGGDIIFQTRGAVERARFNGFAGINLAQGDPTGGSGTPPALQLFWSDTGDNKLIAVDPSGAVYSVDLTAL